MQKVPKTVDFGGLGMLWACRGRHDWGDLGALGRSWCAESALNTQQRFDLGLGPTYGMAS